MFLNFLKSIKTPIKLLFLKTSILVYVKTALFLNLNIVNTNKFNVASTSSSCGRLESFFLIGCQEKALHLLQFRAWKHFKQQIHGSLKGSLAIPYLI